MTRDLGNGAAPAAAVVAAGDPAKATENPRLLAALGYVQRGWPVLPLHSPASQPYGLGCSCGRSGCSAVGKHPRTAHGLKDAATDPATIRGWWRQWP